MKISRGLYPFWLFLSFSPLNKVCTWPNAEGNLKWSYIYKSNKFMTAIERAKDCAAGPRKHQLSCAREPRATCQILFFTGHDKRVARSRNHKYGIPGFCVLSLSIIKTLWRSFCPIPIYIIKAHLSYNRLWRLLRGLSSILLLIAAATRETNFFYQLFLFFFFLGLLLLVLNALLTWSCVVVVVEGFRSGE